MTAYLLDTNHASPLVTLHHPLRAKVLAALEEGHIFSICVPALTEVLFGIGVLPRAIENRTIWRQLQAHVHCYSVEGIDSEVAADLQILLRRNGYQLTTIDALIAVIALRYDLLLLTKDKDFNVIPGLRCENWL